MELNRKVRATIGAAAMAASCGVGHVHAHGSGTEVHRPSAVSEINQATQTIARVAQYKKGITALVAGKPDIGFVNSYVTEVKFERHAIVMSLDDADPIQFPYGSLSDIRVLETTVLGVPYFGVYVSPQHAFWPLFTNGAVAREPKRQLAVALADALHSLYVKVNPLSACLAGLDAQAQFATLKDKFHLSVISNRPELLAIAARPSEQERIALGSWIKGREECVAISRPWFAKFHPNDLTDMQGRIEASNSVARDLIDGKLTYGEVNAMRLQIVLRANAELAARNLQARDFKLALTYANGGLELDPGWAEGYYLRAQAHAGDKAFEKAVADANEYLKRAPEGANAGAARERIAQWQEAALPDEVRFEKVAKAYREAQPKPAFPESARKLKVQAESALREKDFKDAQSLYRQALDLVPWWADGRYNRALILGELKDYREAMVEMKRFLVLAPDSPDARAAQDRIYEWERKAGR